MPRIFSLTPLRKKRNIFLKTYFLSTENDIAKLNVLLEERYSVFKTTVSRLKLQSKIWPNSLPTSYKTEPAQTTYKTILLKTTVKTVFKKIVWTGSGLQDFYSCAQISCTEHDNQPGSLQLGSENLQRIRET